MQAQLHYKDFLPQILPQKMNGKLNYRISIKKDHKRLDKTHALYLYIYQNGKQKKINLNISVPLDMFDKKNQRVRKKYVYSHDYNLLIEKKLADVNKIEINYRLNNERVTIEKIVEDLNNPSLRLNFISFISQLLQYQIDQNFIKASTHRQQKGFLEKLKRFQDPILFSEINIDFIKRFRAHLKNIGNKNPTIEGTLKNFKKYLHAANEKGIRTELRYTEIKIGAMTGNFTFLMPEELNKIYHFYKSPFINPTWKNILQRYLFSCFTGLRISDIELIKEDNFIGDHLVWQSFKTNKLSRIQLNETAKELVNLPHVFNGNYTREYINRELKKIAKICGIKKRLYYHSSRHTFATNYLISGGSIKNLQKAMSHSKIETTMVYAHAVDSIMNDEIVKMDDLIKSE